VKSLPDRLSATKHPLLCEINTRVLLAELSAKEGRHIGLGEIPEDTIESWAGMGFDAIWLVGIWSTGTLGREIALENLILQNEFGRVLPDWTPEDVGGTPFAICSYTVDPRLGTEADLRLLRERLAQKGLGLILDFVANHTARDAEWLTTNPEYYVHGQAGDADLYPDIYFTKNSESEEDTIALGRDPVFTAWRETAQLNIFSRATQQALTGELHRVARLCDGVRCDMAMLLLRDVFERTWSRNLTELRVDGQNQEFWKNAIASVRKKFPLFLFIAEAYWNRDWDLQELGFDFTYDKVLYDRLLREGATSVREHLIAETHFQARRVRFLESHHEDRAASAFNEEEWHFASATIMATVPGMALFREGQLEGYTTRLPLQLLRRKVERGSDRLRGFYRRLLGCLDHPVFREGEWTMLTPLPAWRDNPTWEGFLAFFWHHESEGDRMVIVNDAPYTGQCYVQPPVGYLESPSVEFRDLMGNAVYKRGKGNLLSKGMYFDMPPYGRHLFEVKPVR
jgi:hypothetical protein